MRTFIHHHGWDVTLGCNFLNGFSFCPRGRRDQWGLQQPCYISLFLLLGHFFSLCPKLKQSTLIVSLVGSGVKITLSGQLGLESPVGGTT
jgi:hypothetical protein